MSRRFADIFYLTERMCSCLKGLRFRKPFVLKTIDDNCLLLSFFMFQFREIIFEVHHLNCLVHAAKAIKMLPHVAEMPDWNKWKIYFLKVFECCQLVLNELYSVLFTRSTIFSFIWINENRKHVKCLRLETFQQFRYLQ